MTKNKEQNLLVGKSVAKTKELLSAFSGFINTITWSYFNLTGVDRAELFGEANVALLKACDDFDALRGKSFESYAKFIIVDALNEYIRSNKVVVAIPKYIARSNQIIKRLKKLLDYDDVQFQAIVNEDIPISNLENQVADELRLLQSAADRASTSIKDLVSRAEFLPKDSSEDAILDIPIYGNNKEKEILTKLLVEQIQAVLTKDELLVSEMLMDGGNANSIKTELGKSYKWAVNRINSIRKKCLKLLDIKT
jgi:DNA-directed RNA polymerase specialized sigma subunit